MTAAAFKDALIRFKFWIAIVCTAILVLVDQFIWGGHGVSDALHETRKDVYSALAVIFGALLGFVLTAYSIVVSLNESTVLRRLRSRGTASIVLSVFPASAYIIAITTVAALSAIFLDSDKTVDNRWIEYIVFLTSVWAALAVIGILLLIEALLEAVNNVAEVEAVPDRPPISAP